VKCRERNAIGLSFACEEWNVRHVTRIERVTDRRGVRRREYISQDPTRRTCRRNSERWPGHYSNPHKRRTRLRAPADAMRGAARAEREGAPWIRRGRASRILQDRRRAAPARTGQSPLSNRSLSGMKARRRLGEAKSRFLPTATCDGRQGGLAADGGPSRLIRICPITFSA
jgi:hypothetical protein